MKVLSNSERVCKLVTKENLYINNHINFQVLCRELAYETPLQLSLLKELMEKFKRLLDNEPNLLTIEDPALVIGDIHGQFYDLMKILSHADVFRSDRLLKTKLVFLGDYVDRGINAVEVMILLICLKIQYPQNIFLLRGNHESRVMTLQYNFKTQCCMKYSQEMYHLMMDAFDLMPLACLVNRSFFCVHGGISDKLTDIKKINAIFRKQEIPTVNSAFCDFIWSDPVENDTGELPSRTVFNQSRDCSIVFGIDLVKQFLAFNELSTIIRGHEVFIEGFRTYQWDEIKSSSSVITVFSAPNYCGTCGNKAAVLKIQNNTMKIKQFKQQQPEKYKFLVKFDVFTWTLPEIMANTKEIVAEMLESIVEIYVPQLKAVPLEKKLDIFVNYAIKQNLLEPAAKQESKKEQRKKEFLTAEEQRNYLFNRSHEYYAQFQKLPKQH